MFTKFVNMEEYLS